MSIDEHAVQEFLKRLERVENTGWHTDQLQTWAHETQTELLYQLALALEADLPEVPEWAHTSVQQHLLRSLA